ncbi:MAG: cysteine--tRNA ligase [Patescibacteria group bacterium]
MSEISFYNTLGRRIEKFKPLEKDSVKIYSCGPTVYNYVHLGNIRAYVFVDLLKRYLRYRGYKVEHVMNITDVDDKTIRDSQKSGKTLKEFTDFYLQAFIDDLQVMNILLPDVMPKATDHMSEIVDLVEKLTKNGYTYRSGDSVYYKISQFKNYGELAQLDKQILKSNASGRLNDKDEYEKEQVNDFVLWKAWQPEDGEVYWQTRIGKGRPGWHIECSAMSMKNLGESFDIHCGGVDLIFPHHTNEIAQSEAATGKKFVNYWLHNAHLTVDGQKMAKSLGNFYTLKDLKEKGYDPLLLRFILLKTHYRQTLNFSFSDFDEAKSIVEKFINLLTILDTIKDGGNNDGGVKKELKKIIGSCDEKFIAAMDDDLNVSLALAAVYEFINEVNKIINQMTVGDAELAKDFIDKLDSVLGFVNSFYSKHVFLLSQKINNPQLHEILIKREEARAQKDYAAADELRKEALDLGFIIEDTSDGYRIKIK